MASPVLQASSNGTNSPDRSDERNLDGAHLRELSISSPAPSSAEYKSPDGSLDGMSGGYDSPRSTISTSSIESPLLSSSNMTRSLSGKMKPKRSQSSYYDEETGTWKCRNCGGTYDMPNPGSRQRREHKKACEETQRLQAIKRAEKEQARREEAAREAALRAQGLEEASKQEILRERNTDHQLQNGQTSGSRVRDDPSIMGAFDTTPVIPEREEVNFEAPKELIHDLKHDAAGHLHESQTADAQGGKNHIQERKHGQEGIEVDRTERAKMEASRERDPPSKQDLSEADQGPEGKASSPLKIEFSGEVKAVNGSGTPPSEKVHRNGSLDHLWIDKASPSPKTRTPERFEQVKYCSTAASNEIHLEGTLYDRLVDLHDDPQVLLTRSASSGPGRHETARIAGLKHEVGTAMGANFTRALGLDRFGVGLTTRKDHNVRAPKVEHGTEAATREDHSEDSSPDDLIQVLIGRGHSRAPSLNHGVEMKQDHSKVLVNGNIGEGRIGYSPTAAVPSVVTKRTQWDSREQSSRSQAAASSSKQTQSSHNPQEVGASSNKQSDSHQEDDDLGAIIARNVGKFWMHAVSVGAVVVIAWIGNSLANRQQRPRGPPPRCRSHCAMNRCCWDE